MTFRHRQKRFPVNYPAVATTSQGIQDCTVTNIHENGLQLTDVHGMKPGQTLRMDIATERALGTVRWTKEGRAGVMLLQCLSPKARQRLVDAPVTVPIVAREDLRIRSAG